MLAAGAFAAVALVAFVVWQRRVEEPLLDVRLFENPRFTAASSTIMVLFFALFGFLFLSTQYLQFVLGYSPSAAGVRVLPYAGAMIVFAPLSSMLVARLGTKRVVTTGMLLFSTGLAIAATVTTSTGYGRLAIALLFMGAGMGLAGAPATESIMGSLPPERANIGSAVNDTTRELGGALGVAIVGSIMSSLYATQLSDGSPTTSRARRRGARESLGAGVQVSGSSAPIADAAREAFVHAMSRASIVVALVAALGAFIAWRYLPAREAAQAAPECGARDVARSLGPHARVQQHAEAVRAAQRAAVRARQVRGRRVLIVDDPLEAEPDALERLGRLPVRDAPAQRLIDRLEGPFELARAVEVAVAVDRARPDRVEDDRGPTVKVCAPTQESTASTAD